MLPPWLRRCTKEVSDDTPRSPTDGVLARISPQPARDERANVRHVLLRLPVARFFCGKSPQNNPLTDHDRTTRRGSRAGLPGVPRERAQQLRQNTEFEIGRHQDILQVSGVPATILS